MPARPTPWSGPDHADPPGAGGDAERRRPHGDRPAFRPAAEVVPGLLPAKRSELVRRARRLGIRRPEKLSKRELRLAIARTGR